MILLFLFSIRRLHFSEPHLFAFLIFFAPLLYSLTFHSGCEKGSFKVASSDTCMQCPPGKYSEALGLFECKMCPKGTYGDTPGATSASVCKRCAQGKYSDISGTSSSAGCKECVAGSFSPATGDGLEKCKNCPRGYNANAVGSIKCDACTSGRYNSYDEKFAENHVTCDKCPNDLPVSESAASYCTGCSAGKFKTDTTSDTGICGKCPIGWQGVEDPPRCEQCDRGMYQAEVAKPYCLPW